MTNEPRPGRARRLWLWSLAVAPLVVLALLSANVVWRHERWHVALQEVRFVDHPEKISAGTAALTVTGYLVATVESDVDFFALARSDGAHPKVEAALCDSDREINAWSDPLPLEVRAGTKPFSYVILVPMRGASVAAPNKKVDLSATSENVCLRFRAATMAPQTWVRSKTVVVPLGRDLREQLAAYARLGGTVQLELDPSCVPLLCQPDFTPGDLRP